MTRSCCLAVLLTLLLCTFSRAATIHVPGEQPTIQAGIDAAEQGDIVLVALGDYYENLIIGEFLTLLSEQGDLATAIYSAEPTQRIIQAVSSSVHVEGFSFEGSMVDRTHKSNNMDEVDNNHNSICTSDWATLKRTLYFERN